MDTKRAAYVSGSAHSPAKTPTGIDLIRNPSLPRRLLPSDGLPDRARLNIYCKPKYLGILVQLLKGSETWSSFLASQFWKLFELHVARCFHSAKLIQGMLSRQLLTQRKHELWTVYGCFPLRFSLREFHIATDLICAKIPFDYEVEDHQDPAYLSFWNSLFGENRVVNVYEVIDMLRDDNNAEPQKQFSTWKKLSLALIVIVDGVVVCSNKKAGRVTGRFIEMLHDIEFFMNYPWGCVSFEATIGRFGPSLLDKDPIEDLKTRFSQRTVAVTGSHFLSSSKSSTTSLPFVVGLKTQLISEILSKDLLLIYLAPFYFVRPMSWM